MEANANSRWPNVVRYGTSRSWGIIAGVGLTLMVLVIGSVLGYNNARELDDNRRLVTHTREVLESLEALLSTLKDAETGQRGYLLTGDAKYLDPYEDALQHESGAFTQLQNLVSDNPDQQARLAVLRGKMDVRINVLKQTVVLMQKGEREAALSIVLSGTGKALMDDIRKDIVVMQHAEDDLLKTRDARAAASYRTTVAVILLTAIIGVVLVVAVGYLFQRNLEQKRRAAFVLGEEKERLRTTLESIGDAVISTDSHGNVNYLNPIAERLTGWTHGEALGIPLSRVFNIVNEATRQPVENPAIRALKEGIIVGLANHTVLIARDGSERPIDDSAAPIRLVDGALVGCVLVFRDVTLRRQTDQALRASEERLRLAQHVSKIGTFEWNIQTGVNAWTQEMEAMYGLSPGSFAGTQRMWEEMVHPDDRPHVMRSVGEALANGAFADEWRVVWGDGSTHWLAGRGMVFKDDDGRPLRLLGINIDITERKQVEEKLRQLAAELSDADHRKDEFIATLAHELRNPLAPIRNGLQFLQRMDGNHAEQHEMVRVMMQRQVNPLVRLVDDLMDVSRITRGTLDLRRDRVELAQVLQIAVETAKPLIDSKGHELTMTLPATPAFVDADATRLAQVFANLLNNAAKYTDHGGRIWLTVERQSGELLVTVKDTGVGIPSEMLSKIFEMFTQVDQTLEKSQGGLGIGLTLARRLIEMHDGKIEARSDGPGKGSEFIVRLSAAFPVLRQNPPTNENDAACAPGPCRILVADDNEDSVMSMALLLRSMGNEVRTADDGLDAVREAAEFEPDVVILDIGMPGLNGYEACRRIREQSTGGKTVMVALSGWGQDEDKRRSQKAGFDYHFVKPVDPATLERLLYQLKAMPT